VAERLGQIRRELGLEHYGEIRAQRQAPAVQALLAWLGREYALDVRSAWHTLDYLISQLDHAGALSSDRSILVEVFEDALGDARLVIHSPYGGRVNGPWGLALTGALRERMGIDVEVQTNDDGILFRLLDTESSFPIDLLTEMGPAEARERILRELPHSAVFGARFRQNAARALLLPGVRGGKRTPFWLQRLRAKDLLQVVRHFDDFPIVAETYRDCLQDVLDLPHLEEVLAAIQRGEIQVVVVDSMNPSPVAQSLLYDFINIHMYEWDAPKAEQQMQRLAVNRDLLQDLLKDIALDELLRPEAIASVHGQLQHTLPASRARTVHELAVLLQQAGDLSFDEIAQRATVDPGDWIARLSGENRIIALEIPTAQGTERRWVAAEYRAQYAAALGLEGTSVSEEAPDVTTDVSPDQARREILQRFLGQVGPVTLQDIRARYAFAEDWLEAELDHMVQARRVVHGRFTPRPSATPSPTDAPEYVDRRTLEQIHRRTLGILRREVQPVPYTVYASFMAHWQHVHPGERLAGEGALVQVLQQLRAAPVVGRVWERDVLPARLARYQPGELNALCQGGELVWIGSGGADPRRGRVRFLFRGEGNVYLEPPPEDLSLGDPAQAVYDFLRSEGAAFTGDIRSATDLDAAAASSALIELVMAGLVTNDSLEAMRRIVTHGAPQPPERKPLSALEEQLARRRERLGVPARPLGRKPGPAQYRAAKRRVRKRLERQAVLAPTDPQWVGRWTLVHRFGVLGKPVPDGERVARQARQLLARHGIVTRESLEGETGSWNWSLIYRQLQRMEMRGEVRRGYFVQDLPGLQYALPEAVERLRAIRDGRDEDSELLVINACDPASLYGPRRDVGGGPLTVQGEPLAFARVPSTWLVQQRGLPVLVAGDGGAHLTVPQGVDEGLVRRALSALLEHLGRFERRASVETWNGEPVLGSQGQPLLEGVGFYRSYPAMVWERRP
jgi:ATP-dependent Lhr-like helicase